MNIEHDYTGQFPFAIPEGLTQEQLSLLEAVNFPKHIPFNKVLIKRVPQEAFRKGMFAPMKNPPVNKLGYVLVSHKAAVLSKELPSSKLSPKQKEFLAQSLDKKRLGSIAYNVCLDGKAAAKEMQWLFDTYCTPVPSVKMVAPEPKQEVTVEPVKEEVIQDNIKNLSNVQKSKVKELYKESGMDAEEISEELGIDIKRINKYITTL